MLAVHGLVRLERGERCRIIPKLAHDRVELDLPLIRSHRNSRSQSRHKEDRMKEPGLDHRHRDKNGEISRKHGNTLVGTLRKIYGASFAKGFADHEKLSDVLAKVDEHSLSQLVKHHEAGTLAATIAEHS
jgi:hypothetical protein